jgi:hypothetical protein
MANPHFERVDSPAAAESWVGFAPRVPGYSGGLVLQTVDVHIRDHRQRDLSLAERSVELHYGDFVLSQSHPGKDEARRRATAVNYGAAPCLANIGAHEGRSYELGPEPSPDDPDGRAPAVVTWHDSGRHYLVASARLPVEELIRIAQSVYAPA